MKLIEIPKNKLEQLYEKKKLTTYEIADIYNCCQATAWKRLRQFNFKARFPWNAVNLPKKKLEYFYIKRKLSTWAIEEKLRIPRSTIHRKLLEYKIKRRSRAESHIIYPRKNFSGNKLEKAYLIGFTMGDLRTRKIYPNSETIHVDCGSTKEEQISLVSKLFKPYGRIWISKPNKQGAIQIECFLNQSFDFLLKKRILMDKWILKNKKYFSAFLAGFTDAEGCISISKQKRAFYSLGNYNIKLLNEIRNRLIGFEIKCPQIIQSRSHKGYISKEGYVNKNFYWSLVINRKFYLLKLFDLIYPYLKHAAKIKGVERARKNIKIRNKKFGNINMTS